MATHASSDISIRDVNRELYVKNAELAVRNKTLSLLHAIDDVALRALDIDAMLREIVSALDHEFAYPFVGIGLCDNNGTHCKWEAIACGQDKDFAESVLKSSKHFSIKDAKNLCAEALHSKKRQTTTSPIEAFDTSISDEICTVLKEERGVKTMIILPMIYSGHSIGVFVIGLDRSAKDLTSYERDAFQSLLGLITIAIQKATTTERLKDTTKKLRDANSKLRELDSLKTEFLSIASHQLRTPLSVLKGYIALLTGGLMGETVPKQKEIFVRMETCTENLIMLVNHLLDLSRIETGKLQVRLEPVDLRTALEWVIKFLQIRAQAKGLVFTSAMPNNPVMVSVDFEKVKEIFMNLIDNAIKYTDSGSVKADMIIVGNHVTINVSDTGHGLTREDQEQLFQKFVTGSASQHVKSTSTTGLGLYVVRKLAEAMNGTVVATSDGSEKGSTFTVTFPIISAV